MPTFRERFQRARLDELGVLVEVAESGSLSAAAKKLARPEVDGGPGHSPYRGGSRRIPGASNDDRAGPHRTGASPGGHGRAAHRRAAGRVGRAGRGASEAYGVLRITTVADIGSLVLAPLLPGFLARHPRVRPELVLTLRSVDLVREGFDVGIRVAMKPTPVVRAHREEARPANIGLYAGTQYAARRELPKQPRDLLEHDNVVFFPGDANTYDMKGPKGSPG